MVRALETALEVERDLSLKGSIQAVLKVLTAGKGPRAI
jgi:hypothetical protein